MRTVTPADCVMDEVTAAAVTERVQEDSQVVMDVAASQVTENLLPPSPPRHAVGEHVGSPKRHLSLRLLPVQVTAVISWVWAPRFSLEVNK